MNENKVNEELVNETASQVENENVNKSVEELLAERTTLLSKVSELEAKLKEERESSDRMYGYWQREEKKVKLLQAVIKSGIDCGEYMTVGNVIAKVVEKL